MEKVHANDDLWDALYYNGVTKFGPANIIDIVAEVPGGNEEYAWWWIIQLDNGQYVLLSAGCAFSGWDSGSMIDVEQVFDSPEAAALAAPQREEDSCRAIQHNLLCQLNGKYPKFTYWGE